MRVLIAGVDGYLGWPLAQHLADQGHTVFGVDALLRRKWVTEMKSVSAIPVASITDRLKAFKNRFGKSLEFSNGDLTDPNVAREAVKHAKPDVVVQLGECPSAPYSMIDPAHTVFVQTNNIVGTFNLMFAMKELAPEAALLKLGTMGEYGTPPIDIPEGSFEIEFRGRKATLPFPRQAGSWYHQCYDNETEVLTEDGWKRFSELSSVDKVAAYDSTKECLRFEVPSQIQKYEYEGDLYNLKQRSIDAMVTPNHRMWCGQIDRKGEFRPHYRMASECLGKVLSYRVSPKHWHGKKAEYFELPGCTSGNNRRVCAPLKIKMDHWMDFLGWYLSEGSVDHHPKKSYRIGLASTYEVKVAVDVFRKVGLKAKVYSPRYDQAVVSSKQFGVYLRQFGRARDKFIPKEIKALSKRHLLILLKSLMRGDGHIANEKRFQGYYHTISKQLADDVQEIALKCGMRAPLREVSRHGKLCGQYVVSISPIQIAQTNQARVDSMRPYKGNVYCCTVSTGLILVRRRGKPLICGNSKVHGSSNIRFACSLWGLGATDVMQGVVYGVTTDTTGEDPRLLTRLDFDGAFGTAINRFCCQAVIGHPLTLYGGGTQKRGFLPLQDSLRCLTLAIEKPPEKGEYRVLNQFAEVYQLGELSVAVAQVATGLGMDATVRGYDNPRVEQEEHYYNPDHQRLQDMGYVPTVNPEAEIKRTLLELRKHRDTIQDYAEVLVPDIQWAGPRKRARLVKSGRKNDD